MHVAQFLDAFGFGPNVEVIESLLPDMLWGAVEEGGLGRIALPAEPVLHVACEARLNFFPESKQESFYPRSSPAALRTAS